MTKLVGEQRRWQAAIGPGWRSAKGQPHRCVRCGHTSGGRWMRGEQGEWIRTPAKHAVAVGRTLKCIGTYLPAEIEHAGTH